jgi:hypothetical protein
VETRVKECNEDSHSRGELRAESATNGSMEKSPEARGLSQTMRDPARRKRSAGHKTKNGCSLTANGHDGESSSLNRPANGPKANGKWNDPNPGSGPAASDDASGTTFAGDAGFPSAAACIGREACAEVAAPRSACQGRQAVAHDEESGREDDPRPRACGDLKGKEPVVEAGKNNLGGARVNKERVDHATLALDAPGFVDEMHARVNLYAKYEELLNSPDLKVVQRGIELLLDMKYGKGAATVIEEAPKIDFGDLPRPQR